MRQQILSGTWANGRLLPSERDMAAQFGVARNTLRRIIRQLEAEGLIESHPGRGALVRVAPLGDLSSRAEMVAPALDNVTDFVTHLRGASPADLMDARALLEPLVAELAAKRATAEDMAVIEAALDHSVDATAGAEFEHWDAQLRLAIARAAHNAVLLAWHEAVNIARDVTPELRGTHLREQAGIVAALRDRDPDLARELTGQHMLRVREELARC